MSWTHLRDEHHTARKVHRCFACGTRIEIGTRYLYRIGVADGELLPAKYHVECEYYAFLDEPECEPDSISRQEALDYWYEQLSHSQPQMPPF